MKRTPEQKSLDYMYHYSAGPAKLSRHTSDDLWAAYNKAFEQTAGFHRSMATALEATLQARIDEEGCSPVFASIKDYLWSKYGAKSPVTQTVTGRSLKVTGNYPNRLITDGIS